MKPGADPLAGLPAVEHGCPTGRSIAAAQAAAMVSHQPGARCVGIGLRVRRHDRFRRLRHRAGSHGCRAPILGGEEPGSHAVSLRAVPVWLGSLRPTPCNVAGARAGVSNGEPLSAPCGQGLLRCTGLRDFALSLLRSTVGKSLVTFAAGLWWRTPGLHNFAERRCNRMRCRPWAEHQISTTLAERYASGRPARRAFRVIRTCGSERSLFTPLTQGGSKSKSLAALYLLRWSNPQLASKRFAVRFLRTLRGSQTRPFMAT